MQQSATKQLFLRSTTSTLVSCKLKAGGNLHCKVKNEVQVYVYVQC